MKGDKMIFAVEHKLGASLIEARTSEGAIRKARRYFGQYAEPITIPGNQVEAIASARSMGARVIALVLSLLLPSTISYAAEVCTDRTEFISVMQTCQIDKKQVVLYKQKDRTQDAIIKELKTQNTELRKDREALLAYKDSADELIEALRVDREERKQAEANRPTNWLDRIEWAGYGASVPTAVLVVRKLILKF